MSENPPPDLEAWIEQYLTFMQESGYAALTRRRRRKHLQSLRSFVKEVGLASLEDFEPHHGLDWIEYWCRSNPAAKKGGLLKRSTRFGPDHHIGLQHSLRSFLRWARAAGHLERDVFPLRQPVRGNYFFSEVSSYLHFCRKHKGLAQNSLLQIELFLRRWDRLLYERQVRDWKQLEMAHLDDFVRQQAAHNVKRIQRVHKILRGFLRYLYSQGRLERDWAAALHSPRHYQLARPGPAGCLPHRPGPRFQSPDLSRLPGRTNAPQRNAAARPPAPPGKDSPPVKSTGPLSCPGRCRPPAPTLAAPHLCVCSPRDWSLHHALTAPLASPSPASAGCSLPSRLPGRASSAPIFPPPLIQSP